MAEEVLVVDSVEENAKVVLEVKEAVVLHQEEKAEEILAEEKVDSEATEDQLQKEKVDSEEKEVVLLQEENQVLLKELQDVLKVLVMNQDQKDQEEVNLFR